MAAFGGGCLAGSEPGQEAVDGPDGGWRLVVAPPRRPIEYTIRLDAPQTQMVEVAMRVPDVEGPELEVALPVWRPGRYVVLDPAGTLRQLEARGGAGESIPVRKVTKSSWRIETGGAATVEISYRIYANSLNDRTRHVDDTHAFLSGESVFLYVPDRRDLPVEVRVEAPADWRISTGLPAHPDRPRSVTAPSYDVLVDSPLEIGLHDLLRFDVEGVPHEIVIWPPRAAAFDGEQLLRDFEAIVRHQASIFGDMPYERYVFQMHVGAGARGGTEHLNSTIMQTSREALEDPAAYRRFLGLVSHEFFHTWNVKQLRPAGIHPYDYQGENYTTLLWVAEGTTSYYDDLTLVRTGLVKPRRYLEWIGDAIDGLRGRPGAAVQSLAESSFDAWIKFNRSTPDDVNSTVSFYSKGALVSLMLDLELRRRSGGAVTLDQVMAGMYRRFPLSGPGYTPGDFLDTVESLSGEDFDEFFARYVDGTDPLPLEAALETVGVELYLKPNRPDDDDEGDEDDDGHEQDPAVAEVPMKAYLGLRLQDRAGGPTVVRSVLADGPAYAAGVIAGDEVVALDGRRLTQDNLDGVLETLEVGAAAVLHVMRRDALRAIDLTVAGRPDGQWTLRRVKAPTEAQQAAWDAWIGAEEDPDVEAPEPR